MLSEETNLFGAIFLKRNLSTRNHIYNPKHSGDVWAKIKSSKDFSNLVKSVQLSFALICAVSIHTFYKVTHPRVGKSEQMI